MKAPVICIDGFSGSGKGTVAQLLAKKLHWHYLESGILYRALAYQAEKRHINLNDKNQLVNLAKALDLSFQITQNFQQVNILIDGIAASNRIRTEQVGNLASQIATHAEVRSELLEKQRSFRKLPGLVTDGRDMGTVVFPDASLKFFFTASVEERALRRYKQLQALDIHVSLVDVVNELKARDHRDQIRTLSPTIPAEDAVMIDTTKLTLDQVFETVLNFTRERLHVNV